MTRSADRLRYLARALAREMALSLLLLLGVSAVVFLVVSLAPGDALSGSGLLLGEQREQLMRALDTPVSSYGRYFSWLADILRGDFGTSLVSGIPVLEQLQSGGLLTLLLCLGAMLVTTLIALPVAVYSVVRGGGAAQGMVIGSYTVSALPLFWLGYVVIWLFTRQLGVFPVPTGGAGSVPWSAFVLPVLLLGIGNGMIGEMIRHLRETLSRTLDEEYIRTARAKGAPIWRHAMREGVLLPVSELLTARLPHILGGAVIVEQIFNIPGLGRLAWQATEDRDFPLIMGVVLAAAVLVRLAAVGHRMVSVWGNPRVAEA